MRSVYIYILIPALGGFIYGLSLLHSRETGNKEQLMEYIHEHTVDESRKTLVIPSDEDSLFMKKYDYLNYKRGEWKSIIIDPAFKDYENYTEKSVIFRGDEITLQSYGSFNLALLYGDTMYTKDKYRQTNEEKPESLIIKKGFQPQQDLKMHVEGKIGERMTVYIDHDSKKQDNTYRFKYKALRDDEVIRELNAGDIDIKFNESRYAVYDNTNAKGIGVDVTLKKDKLTIRGFGSVLKGVVEAELFRGSTAPGTIQLNEYQYMKRSYYQIEPLIRYNNMLNPPYPDNYTPSPVNIMPTGFEIYMDDQNPYNNYDTIQLSLDGGYYSRLQAGTDYKINFITGTITFLKEIIPQSRIFVVYNTMNGYTTDPYALQPNDPKHPGGIFLGKIFVFIKYGYSITETAGNDRNNDGKINQDIYEVRSNYYIGDRQILSDNLIMQFFRENGVLTIQDIKSIGPYTIDYTNGLIQFVYREPFKSLCLASNTADKIYNENQPENVFEFSRFKMRVDYYRESRSYHLKHTNIIPDSVTVKINGKKIDSSLYTVDYTSGYLSFNNPLNPVIGPDTIIEIRYQYMEFGSQSNSFVGGLRGDYQFNKYFRVGSSMIYSRSADTAKIPELGNEPVQTTFYEGDGSLVLDGKALAKIVNFFSKKKYIHIPLEIKAYAEYAVSYKNTNTFGKALMDNMEAAEDIISISLSEKDWILSSRPSGVTTRARLNYYFYRDPINPEDVKGITYAAPKIDYSVKPGPFNVAFGHVLDSITSLNLQRSLALDFDNSGDYVSVVTRRLTSTGKVDFSGVQYVEISYKYDGATDVNLYLDVGRVNEDSDGDGVLDTEDLNNNNFIDSDAKTGISEDIGYLFNESGSPLTRVGGGVYLNHITRGDGILTSEDLNGNGILDVAEDVFSFQGQSITLKGGDGSWQVQRIYIDHSTLTTAQATLLSQVESARLTIRKGAAVTGRVYIDSIRFVSSKYRDVRMDGMPASPDRLKVALINSNDDNEYRFQSIKSAYPELYRSMYGIESSEDLLKEKETALRLEYSIPATNRNVSVSRRFPKPMDIRHYKTLTVWTNYRLYSPGDKVGVVIGSSDTDFIEYQFPMDYGGIWRENKLRLKSSSQGEVFPAAISGIPDLKRITYIKLIIYGASPPSSGLLWVNEIYCSDPEVLKDSAHWYEGELNITEPLFKTKGGIPILSDISVKYIEKGHGQNFSTVMKTENDMSEKYRQLFSTYKILPNWETTIDYIREESETESLNEAVIESKRGKTGTNSVMVVTDYVSNINNVPSIKISYKYSDYDNSRKETIGIYSVNKNREYFNNSSTVVIRENINNVAGGRLYAEVLLNMFFKKDETRRRGYDVDMITLNTIASIKELEKRQRSDLTCNLDYTSKLFSIKPTFIISSEETVRFYGKASVLNPEIQLPVIGDFHFPFIYNKDMRFNERNKQLNLVTGIGTGKIVSLVYKIDLQYFENRFRDQYPSNITYFEFERFKDARSMAGTSIEIPLNLYQIKQLRSIKTCVFSYNRSLFFSEYGIPYEGEHKSDINEKFGMKRSLFNIIDSGMNLYRYYPFYFWGGRNNFANGRDYVINRMNAGVVFKTGTVVSEYTNQLRMIDNATFNCSMDYKKFSIESIVGINQVCERMNVYGIPTQVVVANFSINMGLDLMKIFSFGFFRPNKSNLPYHSAFISLAYRFSNNMIVTSNIEEMVHSPEIGFNIKRDRLSLGSKFSVDFRKKHKKVFISYNALKRSPKDDIYSQNMPQYYFFHEIDEGYNLSALFEIDVKWLHRFFSLFYRLVSYPIYTFEYTLKINRYDYLLTTSPQPYDMHLISSKLKLDLHKNIQGGFSTRFALEKFRNKINTSIKKELFSYELGLNLTILF